jgi:UDP-arabinose 4-epimerase
MADSSSLSTVLVAGGAGYIGSHTAKVLLKAGIQPIVLDNLCTGFRSAVQFGPFYEGSIGDAGLLKEIIAKHLPQGAILFAGHAYVGESTSNPRKYYRNNVVEALTFLNNVLDLNGPKSIVFSSSCSVYGIQEKVPIAEDSSQDPLSPYAETKAFFERVLRWYGSAYGFRYASLRYFNAAGADPEGELGENHDPETHLIPLTILAAMGGERLRIFGTDYATPDGTAIRDYIHVMDLADAHLRALRRLHSGADSFAANLGTGQGYSVLEVIRQVEKTGCLPVPTHYGPRREGDAPALVADPRFVRELLGWDPKYSSLETIVQTAWNWYARKNGMHVGANVTEITR